MAGGTHRLLLGEGEEGDRHATGGRGAHPSEGDNIEGIFPPVNRI